MSAQDKAGGESSVPPWFDVRGEDGGAADEDREAVATWSPPPGWKWNGKDWEYSSRHLNERHLRPVS